MSLAVGTPWIKSAVPQAPWLPGVLAGALFCAAWFLTNMKTIQPSLSKTEWSMFKLILKTKISPNTAVYKFALPSSDSILGLPIGQHISVGAKIDGKDVMRSYTPTSSDDDKGYFELLVKTYPSGNISKYLDSVKIGDFVRVKGPKGNFVYTPNMCKNIGMIAGGTGITPMLQIIKAVLKNPQDKTKLSLIFANVAEEDILLRAEIDSLVAKNSDRFKVYYVLNTPPKGWTGGDGFVTKAMIEKNLAAYTPESKVLLCGPPPMIKAMTGYVEELGYPTAQAISKLGDAIFKF